MRFSWVVLKPRPTLGGNLRINFVEFTIFGAYDHVEPERYTPQAAGANRLAFIPNSCRRVLLRRTSSS